MYGVVGHTDLRARLAAHTGSYALIGPPGVGKAGVVHEWAAGRLVQPLAPADLDQAIARPGLLHLLDGGQVRNWTPFLRPLEEDAFPLVIITDTDLPAPITSRLPLYRAGYLTETEVTQILARDFPRLTPRPLVARHAQGSLDGIEALSATLTAVESLDRCLAENRRPDLRKANPLNLHAGFRTICRAVLGLATVPVSEAAKKAVPRPVAAQFLAAAVPTSRHEARNAVALLWARLHG